MSHYANSALAPRTFTEAEVQCLLRTTGERSRAFRDHMILSVSLATALREHELAALNVGDLYNERGGVRVRAVLRVFKRSNRDVTMQEVVLAGPLRAKLAKYREWKEARGESLAPDAPLFVSQMGFRISTRQLRTLIHVWQARAGFDRHLSFHGIRHTAVTGLYRRTKDIRLAQRFARHKDIKSTVRYTHASDDELAKAVAGQTC